MAGSRKFDIAKWFINTIKLLVMNFLCAITYPARTAQNILRKHAKQPEKSKGKLWISIQSAVSTAAEKLYDIGIASLHGTIRSTRNNNLYHRPKNMVKRIRKKKYMSVRLPVMLSIASMLSFAAETDKMTALISKHNNRKIHVHERATAINTRFDTDSFTLGVDNHASACISNAKEHFKDLRRWKGSNLKGVGTTPITGIGTLIWNISDDSGKVHQLRIPNSLLLPTISKCLLSPQHLAKDCATCDTDKTNVVTGAYDTKLHFGAKGNLIKTIQHNKASNVPETRAAPRCKQYHNFVAQVNVSTNIYQHEAYCAPCDTKEDTAILRKLSMEDDKDNGTVTINSDINSAREQPNSVQIVPDTNQITQDVPNSEQVQGPSTVTEQFDEEEMINLAHPSRIRDLN